MQHFRLVFLTEFPSCAPAFLPVIRDLRPYDLARQRIRLFRRRLFVRLYGVNHFFPGGFGRGSCLCLRRLAVLSDRISGLQSRLLGFERFEPRRNFRRERSLSLISLRAASRKLFAGAHIGLAAVALYERDKRFFRDIREAENQEHQYNQHSADLSQDRAECSGEQPADGTAAPLAGIEIGEIAALCPLHQMYQYNQKYI